MSTILEKLTPPHRSIYHSYFVVYYVSAYTLYLVFLWGGRYDTFFQSRMAQVCFAILLILLLSNCQHQEAGPISLESSAEQDDAVAQYTLGEKYAGMERTENHKTAVMWFRKSAEQGYAKGQWDPPMCIKSDNGSEFIAKKIQDWLGNGGVKTRYIDPGSPWQNGHNESFNAVFRDGCIDR